MSYQPFYFAWVDADQTIFDPVAFARFDENIFKVELKHDEGQYATLDIAIKNPRVGLLNPGRKVWAWLARNPIGGGPPVPLFFGVLIGIPSDFFQEKITLKFIAQPENYIEAKQAVAESLKVMPFYDPIWLAEDKRDDPDAILEGYSSLYHIDRVTLATSASDILVGEDGDINFTQSQIFYDSVKMEIGEAPLTDIHIEATASWNQHDWGLVPGPDVFIETYTGDTILSEWPKGGASVGGGWSIEQSYMIDTYKTNITPMAHYEANLKIVDPGAEDCSILESHSNSTYPALLGPSISGLINWIDDIGLCDPPNMLKNPSASSTGVVVPLWNLHGTWTWRYQSSRDYTETLIMDIFANTQAVFTSPKLQSHTETISINSARLSEPLIEYDAWSDFANSHVDVGQTIFPNDPTAPGGLSYQICIQAGTAGSNEPTFSDIPGTITVDGTVHWASLGNSPLGEPPDWGPGMPVATGEVIRVIGKAFDINTGKEEINGAFTYLLALRGGVTRTEPVEITYIPPIPDNDAAPEAPRHYWYVPDPLDNSNAGSGTGGGLNAVLVVGGGVDPVEQAFAGQFNFANEVSPGGFDGDGSLVWFNLGPTPTFLRAVDGGTPVVDTANNFFPTPRGQLAVEHLICKARARLRMRARTVKITFQVPFDDGLTLSCRQNAVCNDPRLPGGMANGKIISYTLMADDGKEYAEIEIGVAVGLNGSVTTIPGTPTYVNAGYVQTGYQQYTGGFQTLTNSDDISYSPPLYAPFDDGLVFPLTALPVRSQGIGNTAAAQVPLLQDAILAARKEFDLQRLLFPLKAANPALYAWTLLEDEQKIQTSLLPMVMAANPVTYMIEVSPVTNGPFFGAYSVTCTPLEIPMGIDLSAPSEE